MYGVDFRDYNIVPDGNYFVNPETEGKNINYWKVGGFAQATKTLNKVKANIIVRVEKNLYYDPIVDTRFAMVYTPAPNHTIRAASQSGYRFPSIFEGYSNINSGGRKRIGGLKVMSQGIFENSYTQSSITQFQRAVQSDINTGGITLNDAVLRNNGKLIKNPYTYLEPEHVKSVELGYRTVMFNRRLTFDVDGYYNVYDNLIAQIDANVPKTQYTDSIPFYFLKSSGQDLYRLWTNSKTVSHNYGATAGLSYAITRKIVVAGNVTYAKLDNFDKGDGLEDAFNTPEWIYNLSIGSPALFKTFGFNVNYREQATFLWQSALATGEVPRYRTIDAQLTGGFFANALTAKIGATNLLNNYYYSFIGGPAVGGFYYVSLTYSLQHWK
jgi:iron complex outermembrane receptor protein